MADQPIPSVSEGDTLSPVFAGKAGHSPIVCAACGEHCLKPTGAVNRARRAGLRLYCDRTCAGVGRRVERADDERRRLKAEYDAARRTAKADEIKRAKRAYHLWRAFASTHALAATYSATRNLPITPPSRDEARERLAAALDLLPDVKARLASGQQPNAYVSGNSFIIGIGPVTNCLALARTRTEEVADMFEQALRLALLSPEQGWLLRGQWEPSACHVLACRFNADCGEWIYGVVASPISAPFTHWMPLPAPPTKGGE